MKSKKKLSKEYREALDSLVRKGLIIERDVIDAETGEVVKLYSRPNPEGTEDVTSYH